MGEPVAPEELRRRLLEVNDWNAPVTVQQTTPNRFAVSWRYVDAHWWDLLSSAGIRELYTLQIKIDDARREVVLVDMRRSVTWGIGPGYVRLGRSGFMGVLLEGTAGAQVDMRQNFRGREIDSYSFSTAEKKSPVMTTIRESGWDVRMALWWFPAPEEKYFSTHTACLVESEFHRSRDSKSRLDTNTVVKVFAARDDT